MPNALRTTPVAIRRRSSGCAIRAVLPTAALLSPCQKRLRMQPASLSGNERGDCRQAPGCKEGDRPACTNAREEGGGNRKSALASSA